MVLFQAFRYTSLSLRFKVYFELVQQTLYLVELTEFVRTALTITFSYFSYQKNKKNQSANYPKGMTKPWK